MRILITGGAGFIGSHLAEALLKKGEEVVVIDNLSTGSMGNMAHLKSNPRFSYHIDTILNRGLMKCLVRECDMIYHLAAAVGVKYIIDNPLKSIETNVKGTEVVLELASSLCKKKVMLASTSEVYGKDRHGKSVFKEGDDSVMGPTTIPRWSYSCTKALDEFLALAYHYEKKLPVIIVRFFNTCGPRQTGRYGMVVPRFIKQAMSGEPITVYSDGRQTRCFTDVRDAVKAVILLSESPKLIGEVFNVGNPNNKVTINALAKKVKSITGSKSVIKHIPYAEAYEKGFEDMRHRVPDISKLEHFTAFSPDVGIDEMLRTIADHMEKKRISKT